jgi:hypothetical protein
VTDWFDAGGSGNPLDVLALMDSEQLQLALAQVVEAGALLSLGLTSDGGALGVTVTVDGRWRREYVRDCEELAVWLSEALPAVRTAAAARTASSASQGRGRRQRGL